MRSKRLFVSLGVSAMLGCAVWLVLQRGFSRQAAPITIHYATRIGSSLPPLRGFDLGFRK